MNLNVSVLDTFVDVANDTMAKSPPLHPKPWTITDLLDVAL